MVVLLNHFGGANMNAQNALSLDSEISVIYEKLAQGDFQASDRNFIRGITVNDIRESPDSIKYRYYYMMAGILNDEGADADSKITSLINALEIAESSRESGLLGIYDIEYIWVSNALAECYEEKGDVNRAIYQYERSLVRGSQLLDTESNENLRRAKADILCNLGELYAQRGFEREAVACFNDAFRLSAFDYVGNVGDTEGYFPLWSLGQYMNRLGKFDAAVEAYDRIIELFQSKNAVGSAEYLDILFFRGVSLSKSGKKIESIATYQKAIEIYDSLKVKGYDPAGIYGNLLCEYASAGDMESFIDLKDKYRSYLVQAGREKEFPAQLWAASTFLTDDNFQLIKDDLLNSSSNLDSILQVRLLLRMAYNALNNEPEVALRYCKAVESLLSAFGGNAEQAGLRYDLASLSAQAYASLNRHYESIKHYEIALGILPLLKNENPKQMEAQLSFGLCSSLLEIKDYDRLIREETRLLPLVETLYGTSSNGYIQSLNTLGIAQLYGGKTRDAVRTFQHCLDLTATNIGSDNEMYSAFLHNIGRAYMLNGEKSKALDYLQKSKDLSFELTGTIDPKTVEYLKELREDE